jgi:glycosyltransferase involved in cell wall biosynthesis
MDISVVIPARNEEESLGRQLDALLAQDWNGDWEIIVADNGSTDGTATLVSQYEQQTARVRCISATEKADQSYAANSGVAASEAPVVLFCDADDIVGADWLRAMADGLATHDVVTGPNELDRLNPEWLAGSRGRSIESPVGSFYGIFPLIRGNNYGVRREVFARIGPLAEDFSRHAVLADQEFSLRCWLNGIDVIGLPDATVHYRYRQEARSLWRQGFAYGSHRPLIAKLLKEAGKPTPPKFSGWKSWILLIAKVPTLVTHRGRSTWLWVAGNRLGQVVGSIRYRIILV